MGNDAADGLILYRAPFWVYGGYLLLIFGTGLLMWAGAEAKWLLTAAGGAGCVLGGLVVWAQRRHLRAWSKRHNIE